MDKIVYFDYCALVIILLVIIMMIVRNMNRGRVNHWFLILLCVLFVTAAFDAVTILYDNIGSGNVAGKYVSNTMYLWLRNQFSMWYTVYILAQCDVLHKLTSRKLFLILYSLPITLVSVCLLLINPITKSFFYLDANDIYTRGPFILVLYILSLVYMIVAVIVLIKDHEIIGNKNCLFLSLAFVMVLLATIIQFFCPNYIVEMFCSSISCLTLALTVQAPESKIHAGTGLYKTSAFQNDVRIHKARGKDFDVVFISITNMKSLLDILGFNELNKLIKRISYELLRYSKKNKIDYSLYYFENGCFAVLFTGKSRELAYKTGQAFNAAMSPNFSVKEMQLKVMANVCFASFPDDIGEIEFLVSFSERLANEAFTGDLLLARNLFEKRDYEIDRDMSAIINRCLLQNRISLNYQPVYSVKEERFVSCEAFLRIHDSVYGDIAPLRLIEAAEKTGEIHGITTYVIEEACRLISNPNYFAMGIDYVEINLSPLQCMWDDFVTVLLSTMENYGVLAEQICINVTDIDNALIYSRMAENISFLAQMGIRLYMDDFGAGVFEIERLTGLPLNGIKLDRDFVKAGTEEENTTVLKNTVKMLKDMGREVIAVGIETPQMRRQLLDMGCNILQGYYYCKPLNQDELIQFLISR